MVPAYDGVDWFWVPSLARAVGFLVRRRPDVAVFQWWTGTVLHTYLALALVARLLKVRFVIEFHETLDTGQERIPWVASNAGMLAPVLFRLAHGYVAHSEFERRVGPRPPGVASVSAVQRSGRIPPLPFPR